MQQDYENTPGQEQDDALVMPQRNPIVKATNEPYALLDGVEVPSLRNEHSKHFDLGENRYQAVTFPEPIHYWKDGQWEEIDNNLEETEASDGRRVLRNRAGAMECELPAQANDGALVKLTRKGHVLTWAFEMPLQAAQAEVKTGETLRDEHLLKMAKERVGFAKRTDEQLLATLTPEDLRSDVTEKSAEVRYEDILPGVSVRYALHGNELKEDIICADREALDLVALKLPLEYQYTVNEDQSLSVRDPETGEERFFLGVPVVYDAASMVVTAKTVLEQRDDYVRLSYRISEDYLALCQYPLTIDPVVASRSTGKEAEAVYFDTKTNGSRAKNKNMYIGKKDNAVYASALKFGTLAALKASDTVVSAKLKLYGNASGRFVGVYPINTAWNADTVTWSTIKNAIGEYPLDYAIGANGSMSFDITGQYREWYRADHDGGSMNNGILFKCMPETQSYFTFSSPTGDNNSRRPLITVDYISHAGLASWFEYESQSAGMAGTTHVDLFNGNVVHEHADTAMGGNRMPVSISHYYNSSQSAEGSGYKALGPAKDAKEDLRSYQTLYRCGYGWKHSGLQWIYEKKIESKNYYVWVDGSGTEHWFKNNGKDSAYTAKDMESMGLTLKRYTATSKRVVRIEIEDKSHAKMTFQKKMSLAKDAGSWMHYWLVQVEDSMVDPTDKSTTASVNMTEYSYKLPDEIKGSGADGRMQALEGRLEKITDAVGRETVFHYDSDTDAKRLVSITTPDVDGKTMQDTLREVRFSYDDLGRLTGIDYSKLEAPETMGLAHHTEFTYQYDANHLHTNLLESARNYDGTKVSTTYERVNNNQTFDIDEDSDADDSAPITGNVNYELCRAASLETTRGDAKGAMQLFTYKNSQTEVTVVEGDMPAPGDKKIIYQFNNKGNVTSMRDELGYAQFTKYASGHENTPSESSKMQKAVVNLLRNVDFTKTSLTNTKDTSPVWIDSNTKPYHEKNAPTGNTLAVDATSAGQCLNLRGLKMGRGGAEGTLKTVQTLKLEMGKIYTFSAYVKAANVTPDKKNDELKGDILKGGNVRILPASLRNEPDEELPDVPNEAPAVIGEQIVEHTGDDFGAGLPTDGWERYMMVYDTTGYTGTAQIAVELRNEMEQGNLWFAAPQLEEGLVANSVNLLSNGDFSVIQENKTYKDFPRQFPVDWLEGSDIDNELKKAGTAAKQNALAAEVRNMAKQIGVHERNADPNDPMPAMLSGKYLQQCGLPRSKSMNTFFYQDLQVGGKKNDIFFLGGWASGRAMPDSTNERRGFYLKMQFYAGSWKDGKGGNIPWSSEWVGWQAAGGAVAAPADYTKVRVIVAYKGQPNAAKFSNIFLFREAFGQSYAFDQNKNLVNTTTLAGQQAGMEYDGDHNLVAYKKPGATGKYKMDYGKNKKQHLLKKVTSPEGMVQEFKHDLYGNTTEAKVGKDKTTGFMKTTTEYNKTSTYSYVDENGDRRAVSLEGGNFAVKQTDARGKVSTQTIHPATGLRRWATAANDTVTHYGYDKQNRLTSTHSTPTGEGTYRNQYTYDESGRLKTTSHNTSDDETGDVTYTFGYDALGAQTEVQVGEQLLSQNVYAEDRTHKLLSTEFANGGKVVNTYDEFDRITGIHFDEETEPRYTYAYGANGQVAYLTDTHLNRRHSTEYDLALRPKSTTTLDNEKGEVLYRANLKYDKLDHLVSFTERTPGKGSRESYLTSFDYDKDDRLIEVAYDDETRTDKTIPHGVRYAYSGTGMVKTKTVFNDGKKHVITYTPLEGKESGSVCPLTKAISQLGLDLEYEYDDVGNITRETRNGTRIRYGYDELGQLVRVDDLTDRTAGTAGTTWVYAYDLGGNIVRKTYHRYTTAAAINPATNRGTETVYMYGNASWKDQVTAIGGKEIAYDAIGNPLRYDGWTYEWKAGRKLETMRREVQLEGEYLNPLDVTIMWGKLVPGTEEEGPNGSTTATVRVGLKDGRMGAMTMELTQEYDPEKTVCVWLGNGLYAILTKDGQIYIAPGEGVYVDPWDAAIVRAEIIPGTEVEEDNGVTIGTARVELADGRVGTMAVTIFSLPDNPEEGGRARAAMWTIKLEDGRQATFRDFIYIDQPGERTQEITYKYNAAGLRVQKVVDGIATSYFLHGKQLMHMTQENEMLHFYYDAQSRPQTVKYGGKYYDYAHNLQGDIVGIVDKNGAWVVEYGYDAWGKPIWTTGSMAETLGKLNPFRYRGYIWDEETGFYVTATRYYNPEWGRFINADTVLGKVGALLSHNLFAYCDNNPVNRIDPTGHSSLSAEDMFRVDPTETHRDFIDTYGRGLGVGTLHILNSEDKTEAVNVYWTRIGGHLEFRLPEKTREVSADIMMKIAGGYVDEDNKPIPKPKVIAFLETGDGSLHAMAVELDFHTGSKSKGNYKSNTEGKHHFDGFMAGASTSSKTSPRVQNFLTVVEKAIAYATKAIKK